MIGDLSPVRRKPRARRILICVLSAAGALFALIFMFAPESAYAGSSADKEIEDQLSDAVDDAIGRLDVEAFEEFLRSLDEEQKRVLSIDDVRAALRAVADGEQRDYAMAFLNVLAESALDYFAGYLPAFISVIVICLLKSTLAGMTGKFLNDPTTEVVHIVCYSASVAIVMTGVVSVIKSVTGAIDRMALFADIAFPVLLTMLSVVGGASSVALYQPMMAAISGFSVTLVVNIIVPAFIATIVFSVVGNLSKTVKLKKMTKMIRSGSTWLIGIVFGLFGTFLTVQGITGGVVDKFGFNAAKFALSSYVPVLGGYLSDGFDLLSASVVLVKNAFGLTGVAVVLSIVLFPLVRLVIFMLSLRLTAAVAEPVGDERTGGMLASLADGMSLLTAALAGTGFMFFIIIMLVIGSCNMGA